LLYSTIAALLLDCFLYSFIALCFQDISNANVTTEDDFSGFHHMHLVWLDVIQKPLQNVQLMSTASTSCPFDNQQQ